jgi:hypothetical protein
MEPEMQRPNQGREGSQRQVHVDHAPYAAAEPLLGQALETANVQFRQIINDASDAAIAMDVMDGGDLFDQIIQRLASDPECLGVTDEGMADEAAAAANWTFLNEMNGLFDDDYVAASPAVGPQEVMHVVEPVLNAAAHLPIAAAPAPATPQDLRFRFREPVHVRQMGKWNELALQLRVILGLRAHWPVGVDCELNWWIECIPYLAHEIVVNCFGDHQCQFTVTTGVHVRGLRGLLCWWVEECIGITVRDILIRCRRGEIVDAQFFAGLNDTLVNTGLRVIRQLYQGPPTQHQQRQQGVSQRGHAIQYLRSLAVAATDPRRRALLERAIDDLIALTDKQFVHVFQQKHKQLDTFLQATLTVVFHIRNDAYVTGQQLFASIEDFRRAVTAAGFNELHAKYGRLPGFNACHDDEMTNLFHNYKLMVITHLIIGGGRTKKKMMEIPERLVECVFHPPGGGNGVQAHRREVLQEIVSGKGVSYSISSVRME